MATKGKVHIGTSGWSYKHWKGDFYPATVKAADWFQYYTTQFSVAEINTSFYHLPKQQTVINWAEKSPPHFLFCPKLSRYITHMKKLRNVEEPLQRFFNLFEPLEKKMGPVLIQLPPMVAFHYDVAEAFYEQLQRYKQHHFVLEVRHPTWLQKESLTLMAKYEIGLVIAESGNAFPYSEMVTAETVYLRFHGPGALYASDYSEEQLADYAAKCQHWLQEGHTVWAFFNNDIHGFAFRNAKRLKELLLVA